MWAMRRSQLTGNPAQPWLYVRGTLRFLLWLLPLLLAASGCTGSARPAPTARTVSSCPSARVPGYSNHRSYPPGIPTLPPPGARIVGCFASTAQAVARGFALPVPRGTLIVHGVFLLPTATVMRSQCRAVAERLGFAVPCPGLLPSPAITPLQLPNCGTVSACVWQEATPPAFKRYAYDDGFVGPPGYHGPGGGPGGQIALLAVRASAVSTATGEPLLFCLNQPPIRTFAIDGDPAVAAACPEGSYFTGGHVLLHWVHRGVLAAVSFHGVNATNIDLDLVVAGICNG